LRAGTLSQATPGAGAAAGEPALTRSVGGVLVVALAVEALVQWRTVGRRLFPRLLASLAPAVGLALYGAYWAALNHDLMAPVRAQHNWQRVWASPAQTLAGAAKYAWQFQRYWLIDVLIFGLVLVTVLAGARLLPGKLCPPLGGNVAGRLHRWTAGPRRASRRGSRYGYCS